MAEKKSVSLMMLLNALLQKCLHAVLRINTAIMKCIQPLGHIARKLLPLAACYIAKIPQQSSSPLTKNLHFLFKITPDLCT